MPDVATSDLDKIVAKVARDRVLVAEQRAIAAELLPAARSDAEDFLTGNAVEIVVNELVSQFDQWLKTARESAPFAPDVSDAQLASLSVHQFEARGNLTTAAAQLENILADRLSLAGVLDEPQTVSTELRIWGSWPIFAFELSKPPTVTKQVVDGYQALFGVLKALGKLEPVARWRRLFELEDAGTLRIALASTAGVHPRIAAAAAWPTERWRVQQAFNYMD